MTTLFQHLESNSVLYVLNETKLFKSLKYDEVIDLLMKQPSRDYGTESQCSSIEEVNVFSCFEILRRFLGLIMSSVTGVLIETDGSEVEYSPELITKFCKEVKELFSKLQSITIKLELLENMFAMLFLRTSDFKDACDGDIDHDNVEEITLSVNTSMTASMDSLSTIGEDVAGSYSPHTPTQYAPIQYSNDTKSTEKRQVVAKRALFDSDSHPDNNSLDGADDLLQDVSKRVTGESSSDTLKASAGKPATCSDEAVNQIMLEGPRFLLDKQLLKSVLNVLNEILVLISGEKFMESKLASQGQFHCIFH